VYESPLRYPGGKGRLAQFVIDLIKSNGLTECHYVEPYAGGAGIALSLLYLEYASHVHLNDLNRSVYAFWRSVLDDPDEMCRRTMATELSMDEWHRQRAVQRAENPSTIDLGFSTFYLSRTNHSGVIQGGVIGGKSQVGEWRLDARFKRDDLVKRIAKVAAYSERVSLYNLDAVKLITDVLPTLPERSLVYLDPPYYHKGKKLYEHHYKHEDHAQVAELVKALPQHWIASYDNAEPIKELYASYRQQIFGLRWTAQQSYHGEEVMIFGPTLDAIEVEPWHGKAA
jgi:DNA adenine methylase